MFQNAVVAHVSWCNMFSQLVKQMKRPGIVQMSKQSELHTWALLTEYSSNTCLQWANTPPRWCYPHHKCHLFTKNTSSLKHLLSLSVEIYWMTRGQSLLMLCLRGFQWTALAKQQPKHSVPQRWVVSFPNRPLWRSPKPLDTAWNMKMLKCIWPLSYYLYNWVCVIHWIIHEFNYVYIIYHTYIYTHYIIYTLYYELN